MDLELIKPQIKKLSELTDELNLLMESLANEKIKIDCHVSNIYKISEQFDIVQITVSAYLPLN